MMDDDDDDDCIVLEDSQIITKTDFVREFQARPFFPALPVSKKFASTKNKTTNKDNPRRKNTSTSSKNDHHNHDNNNMDIDENEDDEDDCFLLDACLQTEADFVQEFLKTDPKSTSTTSSTKNEQAQNDLMIMNNNDEDDDCILLDKSQDLAKISFTKDKPNFVSGSKISSGHFNQKSTSNSLEALLKNLKPITNEERNGQECMIFYHRGNEEVKDLDETSIQKLKIEEDEKWRSVYERFFKKDLDQQLEKVLYERYAQGAELTDSDKIVIQLEKREVIQEKKIAASIVKHSATFSSLLEVTPDEGKALNRLSDRVFEGIIVNNQDKLQEPNILNPLISACESDLPKIAVLTRYGILPKMKVAKLDVRKLMSLIQQIVNISEKIAYEELFLPLFQEDVQVHKSFLVKINLKKLIINGLLWLEKEDRELRENQINILTVYFERNTYLDEQEALLCITILDKSLRYNPNDQKIVQYFVFIVRKFIDSFTEEEIEKLKLLNNIHNCTMFKPVLEGLFQKKNEKSKRNNDIVRALRCPNYRK